MNDINSSNVKSHNSPRTRKPKENKSENFDLLNLSIDKKISKKENRHINLSFLEYFIHLWAMENNPKYSFFLDYKDFIYKDISLEVLVPLIERLLKFNFLSGKDESSKQFISKMSSTLLNYNNMSNGRYKKNFKN
jgi:hypothetical protein